MYVNTSEYLIFRCVLVANVEFEHCWWWFDFRIGSLMRREEKTVVTIDLGRSRRWWAILLSSRVVCCDWRTCASCRWRDQDEVSRVEGMRVCSLKLPNTLSRSSSHTLWKALILSPSKPTRSSCVANVLATNVHEIQTNKISTNPYRLVSSSLLFSSYINEPMLLSVLLFFNSDSTILLFRFSSLDGGDGFVFDSMKMRNLRRQSIRTVQTRKSMTREDCEARHRSNPTPSPVAIWEENRDLMRPRWP